MADYLESLYPETDLPLFDIQLVLQGNRLDVIFNPRDNRLNKKVVHFDKIIKFQTNVAKTNDLLEQHLIGIDYWSVRRSHLYHWEINTIEGTYNFVADYPNW